MFLSQSDVRDISRRLLEKSRADSCSIAVEGGEDVSLRFARNSATTNVAAATVRVRIESHIGARTGAVATTSLDDGALARAMARSEEIARLLPPDPEFMPPLGPRNYPPTARYDEAAATASLASLSKAAAIAIAEGEKRNVDTFGYAGTGRWFEALANSAGLFAYDRRSGIELSVTARNRADAWSGWAGEIALSSGGGWLQIAPVSGLKAWVKAERLTLTFEDGAWRDGVALTAHGGRVTLRAKEEELTLAGAYVETADAAFIPDRAVVLGVAARTTLAITGATSYGVGVAANTTQFGNLLNVALDSTNVGVIGPAGFYADTKARVTANGGNFTAGKVRLIVYFLEMSAPTS